MTLMQLAVNQTAARMQAKKMKSYSLGRRIYSVLHTTDNLIICALVITIFFPSFIAYSGRFATLNNVEFPVSRMNRILTNKVGTEKRRKLKELQIKE